MILHSTIDPLVPTGQVERFIAKLTEAGVVAKPYIKKGGRHGWPGLGTDCERIADWFDIHLRGKAVDLPEKL